jgi:hypothetical protein
MKDIKNNPPIPKPVSAAKGNVQRKTGSAYMKPDTIEIKPDNIKKNPDIGIISPPAVPIDRIGA